VLDDCKFLQRDQGEIFYLIREDFLIVQTPLPCKGLQPCR